jgi:hypothetical protein
MRVVEFGPGRSTELLVEHSEAEIWSLETSLDWYDRYKDEFDPKRVHVIHQDGDLESMASRAFSERADLVFIDGGDRLSALKMAYELVEQTGAVYLHDAHREEYEPGIRLYPFVYFPERHSCILCRHEQLHQQIRDAVVADYSCACQYCSSPERRAYFDRMSGS